jgi:Ran GTPase-activating protein (RanGAP) involved in mRNA processing and transport
LSGFVSLCTVLGKVTEVNVSDCALGPASMPELAKIFSDPSAAIAHVALCGNMITGSTDVEYSYAKYDLDLSGIIALGQAVVVSKTLTSIDLSNCGISVAGVTEVANFISAGAVLVSINLSGNRAIDQRSRSALQESASSRQPSIELIWNQNKLRNLHASI